MKRLLALSVGASVLLALFVSTSSGDLVATVTSPSRLESASMASVGRTVTLPLPKPRFTRTMYASVKLPGASVMLDACDGPIAVDIGKKSTVLIAQHDYCGGSAWISKLGMGDAVALKGDGVTPGTYVVTEIRFQLRNAGATVGDLPKTDAVLQTCVSKTKMVLVGLEKLDPVTVTS
jgi:hypothetical protein